MNQPPPTEKQTGKRIVSKREYALRKTLAVSLSGGFIASGVGVALLLISLPCGYYMDVWAEANARISMGYPPDYQGDLDLFGISFFWLAKYLCIVFVPVLLISALLLRVGSRKSWETFRANTADLPAPDSLVRASAEPVQEPQAVLLRAGTEAQEWHEEQLVRASAGGTE